MLEKVIWTLYFIVFLLLAPPCHANDQLPQAPALQGQFSSVDELIADADAAGVAQEVIEIKEISLPELWFRKLGGSIFMSYLAAKQCICQLWKNLTDD